jgi:Flp pilus assembly protein TadD
MKGMYIEAVALFEKARSLAGDLPVLIGPMGQAYALAGMEAEARKQLQRLNDMAERRYVASSTIGMLHYCLGEHERALELLERGVERHESQVILFGVHPIYEPLRSQPRFQALMKRIGLAK